MRKKLITLLLAVVASVGTLLAQGACGENLNWVFTGSRLIISGTGAMNDYGTSSSTQAPWYTYRSDITTIIIEDGVSSIGNYAFYSCSKIQSVSIPSSVRTIGEKAFNRATALTAITIPEGTESLGNNVFEYCIKLTAVNLPSSLVSIGKNAFLDCSELKEIKVAPGNKNFSDISGVLYGDNNKVLLHYPAKKSGTTYIIPQGVITIGDYAFYKSALTGVDIPNSVVQVGEYAFGGCSSITSINVSENINSIGSCAFRGCTALPVVDNIRYAGVYLVDAVEKGKSSYNIQEGTKWIGDHAFEGCTSCSQINIPNGVVSIGYYAFRNCSSLSIINIPNSVMHIEGDAFYECTNLPITDNIRYADTYLVGVVNKSLSAYAIKEGTKWIGANAFASCNNLRTFDIPDGITHIGNNAFAGCSSMQYLSIPPSVSHIGYGLLSGANTGTIHISDIAAWCNVELEGQIANYPSIYLNGELITDLVIPEGVSKISKYTFRGCSHIKSVQIPNTVISIEDYAFKGCGGINSLIIPSGVSRIGEEAFSECWSLTSIEIPSSVTYIGESAFSCTGSSSSNLTSISVDENNSNYCSIDGILFNKIKTTLMQYPAKNPATSCVIPASVTKIEDAAFYHSTNLTEIYCYPINPPALTRNTFVKVNNKTSSNLDAVIYVPTKSLSKYQSAQYWKALNIKGFCSFEIQESPSNVIIAFTHKIWENNSDIASIGIEGGEQQPGNVLEYIGLEPNSEYKDVPIVLTSNTGETETVNVSFTTTALELTTKASKPVSATTALLFAETNMSDAEVSCGFEWKRENAPDAMEGTKVYCPVASGQMAGRLKNLKDDVYYKYRAFYQSTAGNMYYGDWQYIFTGDATVEFDPILYTYGASVVTENEATVSGYALAGSEDFDDQGLEYWAESRVNGQRDQVPSPRRMVAGLNEHFFVPASGIKMTVTLTDLDEGTVYKYRVYGKVGDQYYYGTEQTFTTKGVYEEEIPTSIEEVPSDPQSGIKAQKILHDGQIYILRGKKEYTVTGQEVK